ncbi:MAG: helix-turn-helix domain-containing protein [Dehalococcoidia bacterium]
MTPAIALIDHPTASSAEGNDVEAPISLDALPPLLAVPVAAKLLGISRSAAYRYAAAGDLPARHLGGRVYIVTALLRELISTADNGGEVAA